METSILHKSSIYLLAVKTYPILPYHVFANNKYSKFYIWKCFLQKLCRIIADKKVTSINFKIHKPILIFDSQIAENVNFQIYCTLIRILWIIPLLYENKRTKHAEIPYLGDLSPSSTIEKSHGSLDICHRWQRLTEMRQQTGRYDEKQVNVAAPLL